MDLFSYLQTTDPNELVKCDGNEYCTRTHDSLKISNGKWFWWSRGIGGASALDYLVKVRGVDFTTAVEAVMGTAVEIPSFITPEKKKTYDRLYVPRHTFSCDQAKKYLLARGIVELDMDRHENEILDGPEEQGEEERDVHNRRRDERSNR